MAPADIAVRVAARHLRSGLPRQLRERRLEALVLKLRRLVTRMRTSPQVPAHALVDDLHEIVGQAEALSSAESAVVPPS